MAGKLDVGGNNWLRASKRKDVMEHLILGKSIREVMRITGCAKETVRSYRTAILGLQLMGEPIDILPCPCGRDAGHSGWCKHRYQNSPKRQAFMKKWKKEQRVKKAQTKRTSQGLRDILFDELEELRDGEGDPSKAMAVANLAKQIINIAKVEMDFHRTVLAHNEAGTTIKLGTMELGSGAASADTPATGH